MATTRPKGFLNSSEWTPKVTRTMDQAEVIRQVKAVIARETFKVSVRFIFYRLVGNYGYPKTEKAYNNLAELLVKARRAGFISFRDIVDSDPRMGGGTWGWNDRADFLEGLKEGADDYRIDPLSTQPYRIELWSEDAGSVPLLAGICRDYPVSVYSTGGFSSVTVTHDLAQRVARREVPTVLLHVGDFDPSGESIFESMSQDVGAFLSTLLGCSYYPSTGQTFNREENSLEEKGKGSGPDFIPVRVALTRNQAEEWDLETAPPKSTDSRSASWIGETVQVQAMTSEQMEEVITEALDQYTDHDAMGALEDQAKEERAEMSPLLREAIQGVIDELEEE